MCLRDQRTVGVYIMHTNNVAREGCVAAGEKKINWRCGEKGEGEIGSKTV